MSFRSFALADFWKCYEGLPEHIRVLADKKYLLFEKEPFHPSLGLQQKGEVWTVDIGRSHRAISRAFSLDRLTRLSERALTARSLAALRLH